MRQHSGPRSALGTRFECSTAESHPVGHQAPYGMWVRKDPRPSLYHRREAGVGETPGCAHRMGLDLSTRHKGPQQKPQLPELCIGYVQGLSAVGMPDHVACARMQAIGFAANTAVHFFP
jgi:hypothetical protein